MQLLDSPQALLQKAPEQLQTDLQDIVQKVHIQSNLCIQHPHYKPLELPAESIARFQQLPIDLQHKYLSLQLRSFLYGIYYNGSLKATLAPDAESTHSAVQQNLENTTVMGVDVAFYDRLHEANQGAGYFSPDWIVVREESDGTVAVTKGGLTLHIQRDRHLQFPDQAVKVGVPIAIRMPRNVVQNGFYMAVGNAGAAKNPAQTVRAYFNLSPDGAVAVMNQLTEQLNQRAIPFSFKALYNPSDYGRSDSAVFYFEKGDYEVILPVLQAIYDQQRSHFHDSIPLFTKLIAPGLAIAEEPDQKFAELESFGMNRCQIVADGLLKAWQQGDDSPDGRMTAILQQFSLLEIEVHRPYLNAHSDDIYTPLSR